MHERHQGREHGGRRRRRDGGAEGFGSEETGRYRDFGEAYDEGRGGLGGRDWAQPRELADRERFASGGQSGVFAGTPSEQHGAHVGKGPKGYQRSDERVLEDVNEALERHPHVDATEIEVECQRGEVTLRGQVGSRQQKRMAEDCAEACTGVREVHNELRVQSQPDGGAPGQGSM